MTIALRHTYRDVEAARKPIASALGAALIAQALMLAAAFLTAPRALAASFEHWDAIHFLYVATNGYAAGPDFHDAFWPGYPLLVRAAEWVTGHGVLVAALAVSAASSVLAAYWFVKWVTLEAGADVARRAIFLVALWPAAVFMALPYSDAAFVAAAAGCIYFARSERFGRAAILAAAAAAIRIPGNALWVVVLFELVRQSPAGPDARWRWLALAPIPVAAYVVYLFVHQGRAFGFMDAEASAIFNVTLTGPWTGLQHAWQRAHVSTELAGIYGASVALAALGVAAVAVAIIRRALPASVAAYCVVTLALILCQSTWRSVDRYELGLFPLALPLARALGLPAWTAWTALSVIGFTLVAFRFAQGGWIG